MQSNAGILLIGSLGTNFSEILIETHIFSFKKMHLKMSSAKMITIRHNGHDGVQNHQPHHCLLNRLFERRSKKTSKLRVTGLCEGISPGTGEFPTQMASNAENVSIWWRDHMVVNLPRPQCVKFDGAHHHSWKCIHSLHQTHNQCSLKSVQVVITYPPPPPHPWTKWPPFRRRHIQMHFLEWKCVDFDQNFTEVFPQMSN